MKRNEPELKKEVAWSYPYSDNAARFGLAACGCYTVALTSITPARYEALAGYADADEAFDHADKLPNEYGRYSLTRETAKEINS